MLQQWSWTLGLITIFAAAACGSDDSGADDDGTVGGAPVNGGTGGNNAGRSGTSASGHSSVSGSSGSEAGGLSGSSGDTGASAGSDGGDAGEANADQIPCDVLAVLQSSCQRCHRDPPVEGAPFPIVTWQDTQANYGGTPVYEHMYSAIRNNFMPLPPAPPLTPSEKETLLDWLSTGAMPTSEVCN